MSKFEPLFLFRVSDRLLFEAGVEFELPDDVETNANLEFAHFDYLLNDYMTVVGGKYLLPFGDFYYFGKFAGKRGFSETIRHLSCA